MALLIWLPLTGDLENKGLKNVGISTLGTITYENGKLGQAARIGSGTQVQNGISIDSNLLEDLGSEYSCSVWVKPTGAHVHYEGAILSSGNWNKKKWAFGIGQNNTTIDPFGPSYNIQVPCTVPVDEWTHIASTVKDNIATIYKNGVQVGTYNFGNLVLESDAANTTIGRETYASGYFGFNGCIQDLRVYNHCLSPREAKELSKGLVLHYPLAMPGQENLYTGSRDFSGTWVSGANWTTDSEQYNGFVVKKKSSIWGGLAQNVPCSNGDIFTISFYAKVDSGGNILSIHRSSLGNVTNGLTILDGNFTSGTDWVTASQTATSWKKYWATVQITSTDITYLQWRIENSVANKFLYVCGMKLERGSRPTPWIPNPADAEYAALGFNDGIEYDVSGYNHNGTKHGVITYDADTPRYETSAVFNGSNAYIETDSLPLETKTISVWIKTTWASASGYKMVFHDKNTRLAIGFADTRIITYVGSDTGTQFQTSGIYIANQWNHLVLVKTGDKTRVLYLNGVAVSPYGNNNWLGDLDKLNIGIRHHNGGYSAIFNGQISDFRAYSTTLSAEDVYNLYAVGASLSNTGVLFSNEVSEV